MRKLIIGIVLSGSALTALASTSFAQGYLNRYRGQEINDVKGDLSRQGFRELGHVTLHGGNYRLMFDGRTCIALHGADGVIDDIDVISNRACQDQWRGPPPRRDDNRDRPPPPPPRWDNRPPPPPGWGNPPPPPPPPGWGNPPPPPRY